MKEISLFDLKPYEENCYRRIGSKFQSFSYSRDKSKKEAGKFIPARPSDQIVNEIDHQPNQPNDLANDQQGLPYDLKELLCLSTHKYLLVCYIKYTLGCQKSK